MKPPAAKRRRTLIGWLAVTAALALAFALVPRLYAPDKADISRRIVEACIQNMPAVPQWQADLAKHGLAGQSERVLEPYCRCLWENRCKNSARKISAACQSFRRNNSWTNSAAAKPSCNGKNSAWPHRLGIKYQVFDPIEGYLKYR